MALSKNGIFVDINSIGTYTTTLSSVSDILLFDTVGLNALFVQIAGGATGFSYIVQGTMDGTNWTDIYNVRKSDQLANAPLNQNDIYYLNCSPFIQIQMTVSSIASGTSTVVFTSTNTSAFLMGQETTTLTTAAAVTNAALTNVGASVTSVSLLVANSSRKAAYFFNDSPQALYLKFGTTASNTSYTLQIPAFTLYEMPLPVYTGAIDGIWISAVGTVRITELT